MDGSQSTFIYISGSQAVVQALCWGVELLWGEWKIREKYEMKLS